MKKLLGCVLLAMSVGCGSQVVEFPVGPDQEDVCDCNDAGDAGAIDPDTGAVVDGGSDVATVVDAGSDVVEVVDANDASVEPDTSVDTDSGSVVDSGDDDSSVEDSSTPDTGHDSGNPGHDSGTVKDSGCNDTCHDDYDVCVAGCLHNRCSVSKSRCVTVCQCTLDSCLAHGSNHYGH